MRTYFGCFLLMILLFIDESMLPTASSTGYFSLASSAGFGFGAADVTGFRAAFSLQMLSAVLCRVLVAVSIGQSGEVFAAGAFLGDALAAYSGRSTDRFIGSIVIGQQVLLNGWTAEFTRS